MAIAQLYEGLIRVASTLEDWISRAAAIAQLKGADAALATLVEVPRRQ